jgi:hypothetical protein
VAFAPQTLCPAYFRPAVGHTFRNQGSIYSYLFHCFAEKYTIKLKQFRKNSLTFGRMKNHSLLSFLSSHFVIKKLIEEDGSGAEIF